MNLVTIMEMRMLAEQITYLEGTGKQGSNDKLIEVTTATYTRLANTIVQEESE